MANTLSQTDLYYLLVTRNKKSRYYIWWYLLDWINEYNVLIIIIYTYEKNNFAEIQKKIILFGFIKIIRTLKLIAKMLKLFAALSLTLKLLHNYFDGLWQKYFQICI